MKDELTGEFTEDRYRQLIDAAPDALVVVGADEKITFVNLQAERMFGYARSELLGQRLDLLVPERFRANHGGHVARFFSQPTVRPMGSGIELFGRRKDGTELPIEVSLSPVRWDEHKSVCAAIRDISERQRLQAQAKLDADRLASAVESIQDALALFDASDRLVLCNSVYRRLVGESFPGPLVGRAFEHILEAWSQDLAFADAEERARFKAERLAARKEDNKVAFDVRTLDGRSLRVIDRRTTEGGMVKTVWDLTSDVRLSEELREARAVAEAASAAKSEFLSSMSHELRTPLNAILGFAQLLQRDKKEPLSDRHKERAAQILKGGEHLLRLIDDILDLSRIEAGGVSISTEPVGVADVLDEVKQTLESAAARAGVALEVAAVPPGLPPVLADRTRFAQVLMNFTSNAIKYNRAGGSVVVTVSPPEEHYLRVTVADTGMGIPADKQDKLFQPFQRAGQETGPIEGTGIGLVISKRLAELMGGRVGFRSKAGEGSEFWLTLPLYRHVLTPIPEAKVREEVDRLLVGVSRQILYIEDNPANVAFMRDLVGSFDELDLLTAPTAEMGVELARSRRPEVIIMDINLPGMSGVDALHVLRGLPETRHIPVIALTAAASPRDREKGLKAGFYRYLTKPVKVDELMSALDSLLTPTS